VRITQFFDVVDEAIRGYASGGPAPQAQIQGYINEPEICPICSAAIKPILLANVAYLMRYHGDSGLSEAKRWGVCLYKCGMCYGAFFARYALAGGVEPIEIAPVGFVPERFPERVASLSPRFVEIFNQALRADSLSMTEVSGIGLRKALEFLIKDYLIHKEPSAKEQIEAMFLSKCISDKLGNPKLKAVASRAVWIGNDFTHYARKFKDFEIADLRRFIDATVAWVNLELTTDEALSISPR
jgi:hypothetical protein